MSESHSERQTQTADGALARRITTELAWSDLVLDAAVLKDVEDIVSWIRHGETLMEAWGLKRRLKPGYRSLFYGPPGTGKTLTALLIGKHTGYEVYRVDLGLLLVKPVAETEESLKTLFEQARRRHWILFFDEADSLFGKRTADADANDRAANQQAAYLLQRIEDFQGVAILASNAVSQVDEAFARRFQSLIRFPLPDAALRLQIWRGLFTDAPFKTAGDVDLDQLAREFELSGGGIVNALRHACLQAVARETRDVTMADLSAGARRERRKGSAFADG